VIHSGAVSWFVDARQPRCGPFSEVILRLHESNKKGRPSNERATEVESRFMVLGSRAVYHDDSELLTQRCDEHVTLHQSNIRVAVNDIGEFGRFDSGKVFAAKK